MDIKQFNLNIYEIMFLKFLMKTSKLKKQQIL